METRMNFCEIGGEINQSLANAIMSIGMLIDSSILMRYCSKNNFI